jgi:hypothetical protein
MDARIRLIRRFPAALLLGAAACFAGLAPCPAEARQPPALEARSSTDPVADAFRAHRSGVTLVAEGRVRRILADDRSGSRHQRFILQTISGHSLLIVHNIDLAPRIAGLQPGEALTIRGEYVWNPQGGLMHWTHHDPSGRHSPGYIERSGHRYD